MKAVKGYIDALSWSLMVTLLLFSSVPQMAHADSSTILGSRYAVTEEEIGYDNRITNLIMIYSQKAGYTTYNWYGEPTTKNNIFAAAQGAGHSYSITFYIGHGGCDIWYHWWGWGWHTHLQYFILADDGSKVYDYEIYEYTSCGNVKFVFLWSCKQGEEIGHMHTYECGEVKARGMPFAWLHTDDLSGDGYDNPDDNGKCFIGFKGEAPFLSYDGIDGKDDAGFHFLKFFYYKALICGANTSIKKALNYASKKVFGCDFDVSPFRFGFYVNGKKGKMVVYGDGNMHISTSAGGHPEPPDPTPPTVSNSTPEDKAKYPEGGMPEVKVPASDAESGIWKVEYYDDWIYLCLGDEYHQYGPVELDRKYGSTLDGFWSNTWSEIWEKYHVCDMGQPGVGTYYFEIWVYNNEGYCTYIDGYYEIT